MTLFYRGFSLEPITTPEPGILIKDLEGNIVDTIAEENALAAYLLACNTVDKARAEVED